MENSKSKIYLLILVGLVVATRIPFLFDGFGHEEDSWGLVVNAWEMNETGHYSASRFPGHPLQEYFYVLIWNQPAWVWNSLSCLLSVVAVVSFYHAMKYSGFNYAFETSLMFACTPIFYISGTYTIDYAWSLAFILFSFSAISCGKYYWCGILLGLAIGCRITSGVFIIPWALLLLNRLDLKQWIIDVLKIGIPMAVIGITWYIPAYINYGSGFFDYSDQFPYPPISKVVYKASMGVFGLLGIIALTVAVIAWIRRKDKSATHPPAITSPARMTVIIFTIIALHIISYLRLPQKSGYLLAIVPFALLLVTMYSTRKIIRAVTVLFVLSSFIFSVNLTDPLRGAESSPLAAKFNISGQEIFIDAVSGPIFAEQSKRRNKMEYVERVCNYIDTTNEKQLIICGWWYNEILVNYIRQNKIDITRMNEGRTEAWIEGTNTGIAFYLECERMKSKQPGYKFFYLPEQNVYNDQMFGQSCSDTLAQPIPTN